MQMYEEKNYSHYYQRICKQKCVKSLLWTINDKATLHNFFQIIAKV